MVYKWRQTGLYTLLRILQIYTVQTKNKRNRHFSSNLNTLDKYRIATATPHIHNIPRQTTTWYMELFTQFLKLDLLKYSFYLKSFFFISVLVEIFGCIMLLWTRRFNLCIWLISILCIRICDVCYVLFNAK